ncbi:MAG: hypothetical protein Q8M66_05705, partial [Actinomycetota bacterium]|nr:hypothetical protein [Actinomycetota bacterium]
DTEADVVAVTALPLAPRALALTLFARVFLADLFLHGTGGGKYDRVTDEIIRGYYGFEPPPYAVATLTMRLDTGLMLPAADSASAARSRLHRLEHNPDAELDSIAFASAEARVVARRLATEKSELVHLISEPGADKKSLGLSIKAINARFGELLAPEVKRVKQQIEEIEAAEAAVDILTDRTYPFCLWSPGAVADTVR